MKHLRRYRIPETRLPFINAEIAEAGFAGAPHLVSSIWGGSSGARLYFWNPESGSQAMRPMPAGIPGAYMLKTGPDGRLYLGCCNGALLRYDGWSDTFETLVSAEMDGITWGGVVTDRYVCWNASYKSRSGAVGIYDWRQGKLVKVFAPADHLTPTALYGHHAAETPDGRVLWGMNVPQARLILISPDTLTARSFTPEFLAGAAWTRFTFLDARRLAVFSGFGEQRAVALFIVSYPGFELLAKPSCELGGGPLQGHSFVIGRGLYFLDNDPGDLRRMDIETLRVETVARNWTGGTHATLGLWQGKDVCAVTMYGEALRYRIADGHTDRLDLQATGRVQAHALCAVPEERFILGAPFINQRFWTVDMDSGEGRDRGRAAAGGGQVNQAVWDPITRRALMSSYTSSGVSAFDPARPGAWPENPVPLASAHAQGQMRPLALVHDGRRVWMATSPAYGALGGALCQLDPGTGKIDVWRNIVPEQRPNAIAVDPSRGRLFFSTDVYADCGSAPPTRSTAQVVAFDLEQCRVLVFREAPEGHASWRVWTVLADGRALLRDGNELLAWDCEQDKLTPLGAVGAALISIVPAPAGRLIGATAQDIGMLRLGDGSCEYVPKLDQPNPKFLQIAGRALYWAAGDEVVEMPLAELTL